MEKALAIVLGFVFIGISIFFFVHHLQRSKQKFVYDLEDWLFISAISVIGVITGALCFIGR